LAKNSTNKITGIIPALTPGSWKVEIKTQFTLGGKTLKERRVIESKFALTIA
jgi:hypothetical protein